MTLRTLKIVLIASAVLMSAATVSAFLAAPYIGSTYLMVLEPAGSELSRLTSDFALPMLRAAPGVPLRVPVNAAWAAFVWGFVIVSPLLLMVWPCMAATTEDCLARWFSGMMLYFLVIIGLFIAVLSGLFVSVAPMG